MMSKSCLPGNNPEEISSYEDALFVMALDNPFPSDQATKAPADKNMCQVNGFKLGALCLQYSYCG